MQFFAKYNTNKIEGTLIEYYYQGDIKLFS